MSGRIKLRKSWTNEFGDTIVEVMLAIAIVSAVLGGAFVSANTSLQGTRQSQERGEAMKLLEGQLELLKSAAEVPGSTVFTTGGPFCLDDTLAVRTNIFAECVRGNPARYVLSITRNGNTFTSVAAWNKVGGNGNDRVQLIYRVYED
jgi:type II secretory pathway pseudopilin PulG